ncbi:hypothetical protein [Mesorhizobium sp.]|uniref:hypothetical protein n=1 Tax=Mesorhizobium sp. TaxID=1871066 RepID=UPI0025E63A6A|nr:hypothetical protein [Mesorhizobium sp.]
MDAGVAARIGVVKRQLEQFQEKCEAVFRPELRENKEIEWFAVSVKRRTALVAQPVKTS